MVTISLVNLLLSLWLVDAVSSTNTMPQGTASRLRIVARLPITARITSTNTPQSAAMLTPTIKTATSPAKPSAVKPAALATTSKTA